MRRRVRRADIIHLRLRQNRSVKKRRIDFFLGAGMNNLAHAAAPAVTVRVVQDNSLGANFHKPEERQPLEEAGHSPELVLRPVLEGMIMTLGAVDPSSEKNPDLFGHRVLRKRRLQNGEIMPRSAIVALGGNALSSDLVIGLVIRNAFAQPLPVELTELGVPATGVQRHAKQIGKAKRPVIDVLGRLKKNFEKLLA